MLGSTESVNTNPEEKHFRKIKHESLDSICPQWAPIRSLTKSIANDVQLRTWNSRFGEGLVWRWMKRAKFKYAALCLQEFVLGSSPSTMQWGPGPLWRAYFYFNPSSQSCFITMNTHVGYFSEVQLVIFVVCFAGWYKSHFKLILTSGKDMHWHKGNSSAMDVTFETWNRNSKLLYFPYSIQY